MQHNMVGKRVSIITPSFNRSHIIGETADSIFNQTYPEWEWVIVDDGSTDESWDLLTSYARKDDRVKVFKRNREPKGAATCRNIAVEKATGEFLLFLDTDDLLTPFCLEQRVVAFQKNKDSDFLIFPMLLFKKQPYDLGMLWNIDKDEDELSRFLSYDPICQGTGTLWKKEAFVRIGMWDPTLALWQDVELHLRSLIAGVPFAKCFDLEPDVFIRISDESLSRTAYHSLVKYQSRIRVIKFVLHALKIGQHEMYRKALRIMGFDLIFNGIISGHFQDCQILLKDIVHYQIFSKKELIQFNRYLWVRKWKLYKISPLDDYLRRRLKAFQPQNNPTLGKIHYKQKS